VSAGSGVTGKLLLVDSRNKCQEKQKGFNQLCDLVPKDFPKVARKPKEWI